VGYFQVGGKKAWFKIWWFEKVYLICFKFKRKNDWTRDENNNSGGVDYEPFAFL
jgi:hypothetical protein